MTEEEVIKEYGNDIAEVLLDRGLVAMVIRNNIGREDITIGGTKRRRRYGFGPYNSLDVTEAEKKNLDYHVDDGHCAIVEYKTTTTYRMVTCKESAEAHMKRCKKEMELES